MKLTGQKYVLREDTQSFWLILKQLLDSYYVKAVDIYFHVGYNNPDFLKSG